ncbi:MAG: hypothetical protein L6Q78_14465 [Bacteroidia bacterium]|nr:hypothetical protein [Bacteroidia bacterium]
MLGELLGQIPEIKELFYKQSNYTCSITLSAEQMATLLATHLPEQTWVHLAGAYGVSSILTSFKNNYPGYFISQAVMYNKTILAATQQSQNLYGGNYGGIENYFAYIRNYFGQSIYDQVTAGFMQQSSVYTDSLRLEEWHLYGSSRIGIYQTNKAMAQRTVRIENGVTTQLSNTHIEQLSLSRFYTERGARRYELANHLGNVLTVVTDKKLPVCNSTSISYYIADVVSATDYSPFGAPLEGRTWQGGEYRYGFNTQERDDEIAGFGNIMTAEFWEYDTRLGRRWNVDPISWLKSWISSYHSFSNNPILNIDPNGAIDGWYEGENGIMTFDEGVHSQADLDIRGICGKYQGEAVSGYLGNYPVVGDENGNILVSLPTATITASNPKSPQGYDFAEQAIQGYQGGIFTEGDRSVNYSPLQWRAPDAFGIQVSGTAIAGAGISQTWTFGYMQENGFFATVGPGEGGGWDQSLSISFFSAYYNGDDSKPNFDAFLGNSNANTVGASIVCIGQSADISISKSGKYIYGENWNSLSLGVSIGTDDVSTIFSGSTQYQQTYLLWKSW